MMKITLDLSQKAKSDYNDENYVVMKKRVSV